MGIDGKQYLKKIIQIPMILPDWNTGDIGELLEDLLNNSGSIPAKLIQDLKEPKNKKLITEAVEKNPRELKRFLNSFILSFEIYSLIYKKQIESHELEIKSNELLCMLALNLRWEEVYSRLVKSEGQFLEGLKKHADMDIDQRHAEMLKKDESSITDPDKQTIKQIEPDSELWEFIKKYYDILDDVSKGERWQIYRRATTTAIDKNIYDRSDRLNYKRNILWVDDHPQNNMWMMNKYKNEINFDFAFNTTEAIEYLSNNKNKYNYIISDMGRPPEEDAGIKLIKKIRQELKLSTPIAIFASSQAIHKYATDGKIEGAQLVTDSPSKLIELIEGIKQTRW